MMTFISMRYIILHRSCSMSNIHRSEQERMLSNDECFFMDGLKRTIFTLRSKCPKSGNTSCPTDKRIIAIKIALHVKTMKMVILHTKALVSLFLLHDWNISLHYYQWLRRETLILPLHNKAEKK